MIANLAVLVHLLGQDRMQAPSLNEWNDIERTYVEAMYLSLLLPMLKFAHFLKQFMIRHPDAYMIV